MHVEWLWYILDTVLSTYFVLFFGQGGGAGGGYISLVDLSRNLCHGSCTHKNLLFCSKLFELSESLQDYSVLHVREQPKTQLMNLMTIPMASAPTIHPYILYRMVRRILHLIIGF